MKGSHFAILGVLLLSGCGGGRGDIAGFVRYQGQPLAGATITFHDHAGGAHSYTVAKDGSFKVSNVPVGTARVVISTPLAMSIPGLEGMPPLAFPDALAKFASPETSGLTCQVVAGTQSYDPKLD